MSSLRTPAVIRKYLRDQAILPAPPPDWSAPSPDLRAIIVIPSLAEADSLFPVLDSLEQGSGGWSQAEALVVVNQPEGSDAAIAENNRTTLGRLRERRRPLRTLVLDHATPGREMARERAGVGLARRLGLDAALARLEAAGNLDQACLACLDADAPVTAGYIDALLGTFAAKPQPTMALFAYAHPRPADPDLAEAIVAYELWLRYFELGFQVSGSSFAFPTLGSCMACSATAYAQVRGLEPRRAAEDFHFLRKLSKLNGSPPVVRLRSVAVQPAARLSDRVPFGTGRAMRRWLEEGPSSYFEVEPPQAFLWVRDFFSNLAGIYQNPAEGLRDLAPALQAFLAAEQAEKIFERFVRINPDLDHFTLAAQQWFDSLKIVRFANECARRLGRTPVRQALAELTRHEDRFRHPEGPDFWERAAPEEMLGYLRDRW